MRLSIGVLTLMALSVPVLIFTSGWPLAVFTLLFFVGIFYVWFCFVRYVISNTALRMREADREEQRTKDEEDADAEEKETATGTALPENIREHLDKVVDRWLAAGGHLTNGITSPLAAEAMGIPRYQLTEWVKASGFVSFSRWIITMRVEEAMRTLLEHRDWSNEVVADHCGFSRSHFQKTFKKETGMSPSEFLESNRTGGKKA